MGFDSLSNGKGEYPDSYGFREDVAGSLDSDSTPAIRVDGLTKTFGSEDDAVTAVDDISFRIEPGEIVGILGPNGAGKTTTIKSMLGIVTPDAGGVEINGFDVYTNPKAVFDTVDAMMEGARNHYWRLTVRENLEYFAAIAGEDSAAVRDRHDELLDDFNLLEFEDEQVRNLSRGMKQKVAIASTLGRDVDLVFLDEPTLGLDVESSIKLRDSLRDLAKRRGLTVVLSSHDMDVIEAICDRVIIMNDGQIIANDRIDNLLNVFKTSVFSITAEDVDPSTIESLGSINAITEIGEDRVKFHVTGDSEAFYRVVSELESQSARLLDVETESSNLEEVFLRLTEGEDQ